MASVAPVILQNGIYLQTREFDHSLHNIEKAHFLRMEAGKPSDPTDFGMITPWITSGYIERPGLFNMDSIKANRFVVTDPRGIYTWQQPIAQQATQIKEICTEGDQLGKGGTTFKLRLNRRSFGNTAIVSVDKFSGVQFVVTEDEIVGSEDTGWVYTFRLVAPNGRYKHVPKEFLKEGTPIYQIGSVMTNYGQQYDTLGEFRTGYREFYNYVGQATANVTFSVTRDAAYTKISKNCTVPLQKYKEVMEMYQFRPSSPGADAFARGTSPLSVYSKISGGDSSKAKKAMEGDIVKRAWIPIVEQLAMLKVERDVEMMAIWGIGGTVTLDGGQEVHLPVGLFHQLNLGSTYTYSTETFQLGKLEAYLVSRLKDKMEPYGSTTITIGTGRAGLKLVRPQIQEKMRSAGLNLHGKDGYITGADNQKLHFESPNFVSYRWEFGIIRFEHVPGLDPIETSDIENPIVNGERLSSYIFIVEDLSGEGGNVVELVYGEDYDFRHRYINGKMDYMDTGRSFQSSSNHPGFEVFIEKQHKAYWVKDITKSLLIKPINPYTKRPIFEPVMV